MYRVAVVRGGPSEEHEVSLQTGAAIISALADSEFQPLDVVVTKSKDWLYQGRSWDPAKLLQSVDIVFIALHGAYGEDGTIQRYLDTHGIKYTGSKAFASALAINKALAKAHLRDLDIRLAPHVLANRESIDSISSFVTATAETFAGPYVVKPATGGSSIGTQLVDDTGGLVQALEAAFADYELVLIERHLRGKEATVGVIERFRDTEHYALPPVEIIPTSSFFDYDAKYSGRTEEICPGRFSQQEKQILMKAATDTHRTLGLSQYSRSDFILTDDGIYFLEVNTLPGLTSASLFPRSLEAVGVSYHAFVTHLLYDALKHAHHHHIA